ncbi:MAG: SAM-dependent methyltransferase [Candidatus Rokubacteria bacterium]|nr:tRNA (N6-threonylcarbamoyladenosine(37)-N6)-methyltransferase TrmO [Chloroflexota bacterium]MBM4441414.1 SAM-dependent methyltransferase [Candidatus Rokubacteria bacterium]
MGADSARIELTPIGIVAGAGDDVARQDWSRVRSEIRLREGLGAALFGLEEYSHVIVVAWLDRVPEALRGRMRAHPGGDERYPLQGALALRGGARPNPVAVTVCRLRGVDGDTLRVEGLDLVDGTPVIDVKPYLPPYDAVPEATLPRWARG